MHGEVQAATWQQLPPTFGSDPRLAALTGQASMASVRPANPAQTFAEAILDPDPNPASPQDEAATYRLHDLAAAQHWGVAELAVLFETVRTGQAAGGGQRASVSETARQLHMQPEFAHTPAPVRREASRLALLVTQQAQQSGPFQGPAPVTPPTPPMPTSGTP